MTAAEAEVYFECLDSQGKIANQKAEERLHRNVQAGEKEIKPSFHGMVIFHRSMVLHRTRNSTPEGLTSRFSLSIKDS